ncbi:hypothetical protein BDR05DRAFT_377027, partial [Suillus weaverae]
MNGSHCKPWSSGPLYVRKRLSLPMRHERLPNMTSRPNWSPSILQVLTPLVNQALPLLISMMNDENLHVKDT